MLTWTVVKFLEENSVEAIPTSWINNNKYNYILAREKAKKAENVSDLNSEISSNEENKKKV
ncbi:hypothetical protein PUN28_013919 [Cardiocondyla obscurior]|uniref:Uncharacterized protein n=1 Tax=Cardiocondyla obscurior TaxID=286306 RepID=A0AAW2F7W6_9HYME